MKEKSYEMKIEQLEAEIVLLKAKLLNAEKRVIDQMMLRELDKLVLN